MTEFKNDKYFVRKTIVYYDEPQYVEKGLLDTFEPVTTQSKNYKNWKAILDLKTCIECLSKHGQIYRIDEVVDSTPPLHNNCRCDIIPMESVEAGKATKNEKDDADYWLKYFGKLPEYYVSSRDLGIWKSQAGDMVNDLQSLHRGKCIQKEFMKILTAICLMPQEEYGMKLISIIMRVEETDTEFYGQMTD